MKSVWVSGDFDDLRSRHIRFLEEASHFGEVFLLLWSDETIRSHQGSEPLFRQEERAYLVDAISYVSGWKISDDDFDPDTLPGNDTAKDDIWVVEEQADNRRRRKYCEAHGIDYQVLGEDALTGFQTTRPQRSRKRTSDRRVLVTGCYDWLHSGHVRFFEQASLLGDLYVVVGHDANVRLLKGEGRPMYPADERLYMVQAVRYVHEAMLSTGEGWLDAEPEIRQIQPDLYVVNEDGDRPEKREYCETHGIEYVVLERLPKEGLPGRDSTTLRGI